MRKHIKTYYHNVNEEFITILLYGHINYALFKASKEKVIEKAFLQDLNKACHFSRILSSSQLRSELSRQSNGLVADIVLHNKRQEGETAGDFGLVISHPQITLSKESIDIKETNSSGLLCQAKLKDKKGKWGKFGDNQKRILTSRMDFTSIVLYSYDDESRTKLNPIDWKICAGQSFSEIEDLLRNDSLDNLGSTTEIITQLASKQIGTQDQKIIREIIAPSLRQILEIKIHWKNDHPDKGKTIKLVHKKFIVKRFILNKHINQGFFSPVPGRR